MKVEVSYLTHNACIAFFTNVSALPGTITMYITCKSMFTPGRHSRQIGPTAILADVVTTELFHPRCFTKLPHLIYLYPSVLYPYCDKGAISFIFFIIPETPLSLSSALQAFSILMHWQKQLRSGFISRIMIVLTTNQYLLLSNDTIYI